MSESSKVTRPNILYRILNVEDITRIRVSRAITCPPRFSAQSPHLGSHLALQAKSKPPLRSWLVQAAAYCTSISSDPVSLPYLHIEETQNARTHCTHVRKYFFPMAPDSIADSDPFADPAHRRTASGEVEGATLPVGRTASLTLATDSLIVLGRQFNWYGAIEESLMRR